MSQQYSAWRCLVKMFFIFCMKKIPWLNFLLSLILFVLQIYKYELSILPNAEYSLRAGFHLHPQTLALVLKGICTQSEAEELAANQSNILSHTAMGAGAGSQSQGRSLDDLKAALQKDLQDIVLQVEGKPCKKGANLAESFQLKWVSWKWCFQFLISS